MAMANAFRSKSLVYRAIENNEEDKAFMHSLWLDPQSLYQNRYNQLFQPISRNACDLFRKATDNNRLIDVLICLPADKEEIGNQEEPNCGAKKEVPIGFVNLHGIAEGSQHHRTLDIGLLIGAEHRGHGYGSEAVRWILNWGFDIGGLHRIGLQSASFNTGAITLWKRLGFQQDGKDREALWINGRWHDNVRFPILEGEWRTIVEREKDESDG
ncbi:GNAT family acetyltransferase [Pyrenochaeta sp. MPI-SDFR-AT-0127]|nr:GNAT family acetyltransferase [Pyrenochaeta sp. MPI-SDFR-AT-0127]